MRIFTSMLILSILSMQSAYAAKGGNSGDKGNKGGKGGKPEKVSICHFDEESNTWELLTLPGKPAEQHLARHDDAAPGGITAQSGMQLDEDCQEAVASEPAPEEPAPVEPAPEEPAA